MGRGQNTVYQKHGLSVKRPCRGAMWIFWPDFWVEFWKVNFERWISWGWTFLGASLCWKKQAQKVRPRNSGPKFGRPKYVSQNSGPNSGFGLKDGKGWGHKRGDLIMSFSTWKTPENPLKIPWFSKWRFFKHVSGIFMAQLPWKVHEKYLKNAWKTLDFKIRVFSGGFQIPPFVPPPFAILGSEVQNPLCRNLFLTVCATPKVGKCVSVSVRQ